MIDCLLIGDGDECATGVQRRVDNTMLADVRYSTTLKTIYHFSFLLSVVLFVGGAKGLYREFSKSDLRLSVAHRSQSHLRLHHLHVLVSATANNCKPYCIAHTIYRHQHHVPL